MPELYRSAADASRVREWCGERLRAWPIPHERERIETRLGPTHLVWAGQPQEAMCLYLPGTNFNAATSTAVLAALSVRCPVVCADLPGQPGLSGATRPADEIPHYATWVEDVLRHIRQRHPRVPLVIAAHSRGAAVALLSNPSEVDALVLLSPAGLAKVRLTPATLGRSVAWLLRPTPARSRRLVDLLAGGGRGDADLEPLVDWMTLVARCTRTAGAPGPLPLDVMGRWRDQPIRVLVGERDVFFPPARLAGPARRLGAGLDVAPDAGHLLADQRPDLVAGAVSKALR